MLRSVAAPFVAFIGVLFAVRAIDFRHNLWLSIASVVIFIGIGYAGSRVASIKRAAQGWLAASLLSLFILLVAEVAILSR